MFKNKLKLVSMAVVGVLFALSATSCSKKVTPADIDDGDFFPITYIATKYKAPSDSSWTPVQGQFEVQFVPDSDQQGGNFTMSYLSYLEPTFCPYNQNCVCSGGINGTYTIGTPAAAPTPTTYDPSTPYSPNDGSSNTTATVDPATTATIYTFFFDIAIKQKSETSGCKPEANRQVELIRFANGEIIMTNDYRQQYLVPLTTGN